MKLAWRGSTALILPLGLLSLIFISGTAGTALAGSPVPTTSPTNQVCVQDDNTGNFITWNTVTGVYTYADCSGQGVPSLTGTGKVRLVNGMQTLTDNQSTRKISAAFVTGQLTGTATIVLEYAQGAWQTTTLHENTPGAPCVCTIPSGGSDKTLMVFLVLVAAWLGWTALRVRRQSRGARS